ncbi:MAG: hypothetical protein O3B65_00900 [Chloroflexi bacterium]|nr:hypothetical protein [Chloroflexota bacterium]
MRKAVGAMFILLLLASCGTTSVAVGAPHTPGELEITEPSQVTVDFFQDNQRIGGINLRAGSGEGDHVPFFVELPLVPDQDYRLDSLTLEFVGDGVKPLIMLAPSPGTLAESISFSRVESAVLLQVADTGIYGDSTIRFEMLASREAFGGDGIRLHANLRFGRGEVEADLVLQPAQ